MNNELVKTLYKYCMQEIDAGMALLQKELRHIKEARNNETKSTAGDKYETTRAMMQIEEDKCLRQLVQKQRLRQQLLKIKQIKRNNTTVAVGNLVSTNRGNFFISVAIGKLTLNNINYFCISMASPIGKLLIGKSIGDDFTFNNRKFVIEAIV